MEFNFFFKKKVELIKVLNIKENIKQDLMGSELKSCSSIRWR